MSTCTELALKDARLEALVDTAGLQMVWLRSPDEIRDAYALAETYVAMLPEQVDPHVAPWVFPSIEAAS